MINYNEISFTSLCYVFKKDYDESLWLKRIADIKNGILCKPIKSARQNNYFENRERLHHNNGPSIIGSVGVWEWSAVPNRNNPETDYVKVNYVSGKYPVRVVVTQAETLENLADQLKNNLIHSKAYMCDTLFCCKEQSGYLKGLLCRTGDFEFMDKSVKLKEEICVLPHYDINVSDVFDSDDKNLCFVKKLQIGELTDYYLIANTQQVIKNLILKRLTWPFFKEYIGATKAEWGKSKILLEKILSKSLYEEVSEKLKCTLEEAKQMVSGFAVRANELIDAENIEADVLARIAMNHEALRSCCEDGLSQKWREAHILEVKEAELEVENKKQEFRKIEEELSSVKETKNNLLVEIETTQKRLDVLLDEIKRNEILGDETLVAIRKKISEAQNDMAGFIAELSVMLPQAKISNDSSKSISLWNYECACVGVYSEDEIALNETWEDEFYSIYQNLYFSSSMDKNFIRMLAAFLYATHIHNIPLLIAGPLGRDIAESLSVSLYATEAGKLTLGNEYYNGITDDIKKYDEPLVIVQNMFSRGWNDELPQAFARINKQVIWTHPYVEDMTIEPKGLYNYMLPVFSECFVSAISKFDLLPSKRVENFKKYVPSKKQPLKIKAFKQLKLSKLLMNQLTLVLSETKNILNQPTRDMDIEILFGLLPLCVVTGRLDVLKVVIDNETGISSDIKKEVDRYIEEE